jgi:predicted transcriptional regulator
MNELQLLRRLVERYDDRDQPLSPSAVADCVDADIGCVEACIERFESNHLVTRVDENGYRPTVTARELLELDIDPDEDSLLILDSVPEEC